MSKRDEFTHEAKGKPKRNMWREMSDFVPAVDHNLKAMAVSLRVAIL